MPALPLLAAAVLAAAPPADTRTYDVDAARSQVRVHVGRAGLLKFAGHEHEIVTTAIEGEVLANRADLGASRVSLRFRTAGLRVTGHGEPAKDVPEVQARMEGPDVLDITRFPEATFVSRRVRGQASATDRFPLQVQGDFKLRGLSRSLEVPVDVTIEGDLLTATAVLVLRHDDFGMKPISVAGVVKVKNEIDVELRIVARAQPARP
jgi:polyisoprenoid-binding protein YceI